MVLGSILVGSCEIMSATGGAVIFLMIGKTLMTWLKDCLYLDLQDEWEGLIGPSQWSSKVVVLLELVRDVDGLLFLMAEVTDVRHCPALSR